MDPTKVVVLGAGPGISRGTIDSLLSDGVVVEHKLHNDFLGDVMVIPRKPRESRTYEPKRKTGAAAIKRASKKAKRRK
ncbi:hypothetical protein Arash_gp144c [Salmonella phage Arash]|nr:hypothetical protein Arash_gp144c [Salmonella phage Arash]